MTVPSVSEPLRQASSRCRSLMVRVWVGVSSQAFYRGGEGNDEVSPAVQNTKVTLRKTHE